MKNKLYIISLGGSIINSGVIDAKFLKGFKSLITAQTKKGSKFIIIAGGGAICRQYQNALKAIAKPTESDLDWMGIYATRFNAELVRLMFREQTGNEIILDPTKRQSFTKNILVGGGWKPGRSSDGPMVKMAATFGASIVINLSNIDYVYTKDPRKFKNAKPLTNMSWKEFRKLVGDKWVPGKHAPFDPTAAKLAEQLKLKVIIANGKNLKNLENILDGKKFIGTEIK